MPLIRTHTAIIGAGAAGLMAAISAGRAAAGERVVLIDSALRPGAKILISGGGRCNVTHHEVHASDFAGSSTNAIRKVLRAFDVAQTKQFFEELGVELKREDTGKLFPTTDSAKTVLEALIRAATENAELIADTRVQAVTPYEGQFTIQTSHGPIQAQRVILATGGRSIPKSGSDGHGYKIARSLEHTVTKTFPALVPLTLPKGNWLTQLKGLTTTAELNVRSGTGKKLHSTTGSVLCTHFGLSGPAVLDVSRFLIEATHTDSGAQLEANWIPGSTAETLISEWQTGSQTAAQALKKCLPNRLADAICAQADIDPGTPMAQIKKAVLARTITEHRLPITGNRGYDFAEVTAGGVPLSELHLKTLESRIHPGLHLCGEICDVDGRIGGFNFQWAWSSGYVAGLGSQNKS